MAIQSLHTLALILAGALDWAAYSPLDVPLEIEARQSSKGQTARVYAARGEYEGFRLEVRAGKKPINGLSLAAESPGKDLPPPYLLRLLPVTGPDIHTTCLDALQPIEPVNLAPGEAANYWIEFAIPTSAKPGVRNLSLTLTADEERGTDVPVRLEIFDFELPEKPSLPSIFYLDRAPLKLPGNDLAAWKPIYDVLGAFRIGLSIWDGTGLSLKAPDTLRDHLTVAANAGVGLLDLAGGNGNGWRGIPLPPPGQSIDPLNLEINRISMTGPLSTATLTAAFDYFGERDDWPAALAQLRRAPAGGRLLRVGVAPLHPDFEPALDAWAIPFRACGPFLVQRLRGGAGLAGPPGMPPGRHSASSLGESTNGTPYASRAADAADGSPYTAWWPVPPRNASEDLWWQADFDAPQFIDELTLYWLPGHAAKAVDLETSRDGRTFAKANVDWEHKAAGSPIDLPRVTGKCRFPSDNLAIRIVTTVSSGDPVPALAEVTLASHPQEASEVLNRPFAPWLALELDSFPATVPGRHLVEPRIIAWACWFGGLDGVVGASLNNWPAEIASRDLPRDAGDFLFYPSGTGILPSMRAIRLRDGLEDYEYLKRLADAQRDGRKLPQGTADLLQPLPLPPTPSDEELTTWARHILETRLRLGRALEELR